MLVLLVHGLHLALLLLALAGVGYLLLPQLHAGRRPSRRTPQRPSSSTSGHEQRVAALREAARTGRLTDLEPTTAPPADAGRDARADGPESVEVAPRDTARWRGLAVGSSAFAAGTHAAVVPHHLEEAWFVGVFFLVVAATQAAWAWLVMRDASDPRLLVAGICGSLALLALWVASRSVDLPLGLEREPVGGWDLACTVWEVVVIGACLVGLRRPVAERRLVLGHVGAGPWAWAALSAVALVVLTLTVPQH